MWKIQDTQLELSGEPRPRLSGNYRVYVVKDAKDFSELESTRFAEVTIL